MNELLSICIPTYNRGKMLTDTLNTLLPQIKPYRIPIFISDNASSDNTIKLLEKFKLESNYNHIYYATKAENEGFDKNVIDVVSMSSSKYVWLLGDDDLICDGAIEAIMHNLSSGYQLLIINASTNNYDYSEQIEEKRLNITCNQVYEVDQHEKLFKDVASYVTFVGSLVINRAMWNTIPYDQFLGSDFVHCAIIFRYIIGHKALVIAEPYIKIRLQNSNWITRKFSIWMVKWPKIVWGLSSEDYFDETKAKITPINPIRSIKKLLIARAEGWYNNSHWEQFIKHDTHYSLFYKIVTFSITIVPEFILTKFWLIKLNRYTEPNKLGKFIAMNKC